MAARLHRLVIALAAFGLAAIVTGTEAQEIDTIAVLVPEGGTDYGWNQQRPRSPPRPTSRSRSSTIPARPPRASSPTTP